MLSETPSRLGHLDGLVQESVFDAECGRLQGETLVGAPCCDPMCLVVPVRDKDRPDDRTLGSTRGRGAVYDLIFNYTGSITCWGELDSNRILAGLRPFSTTGWAKAASGGSSNAAIDIRSETRMPRWRASAREVRARGAGKASPGQRNVSMVARRRQEILGPGSHARSRRDLWQWIGHGAHIYVCGDAKRMAKDVERSLSRSRLATRSSRRAGDRLRRVAEQGGSISGSRISVSDLRDSKVSICLTLHQVR
jgi:hypothetical protein